VKIGHEQRSPKKWRSGTSHFLQTMADFERDCSRAAIDWSAMRNNGWKLPEQVLRPIRVGHYDLDFAKIPDGPCPRSATAARPDARRVAIGPSLSSPRGSLLFECQGEGRVARGRRHPRDHAQALDVAPGGKLRFTVIGSVGLGQESQPSCTWPTSMSSLSERKSGPKKSQIEKRLTDLSEHMENVFQAYLRNEFESIEE